MSDRTCQYCKVKFEYPSYLKRHQRTRSGICTPIIAKTEREIIYGDVDDPETHNDIGIPYSSIQCENIIPKSISKSKMNNLECEKCHSIFKHYQSKMRHVNKNKCITPINSNEMNQRLANINNEVSKIMGLLELYIKNTN